MPQMKNVEFLYVKSGFAITWIVDTNLKKK